MTSNLVSVIITTKNSAETLPALLKSIKEQSYKNIETILVDNNSKDQTKEIAKEFTNLVFNKGPERSAQRNFGATKAKGSYLLFLDSDMVLGKDVVKECVDSIGDFGGLIIPEYSFGSSFWAKCKALERSYYHGNENIEAARFYKEEAFRSVGGFDEQQTGTEDWDLSKKINNKFGLGRVKEKIGHNEGNLSLMYLLSKKYYYARTLEKYMTNRSAGLSLPEISPIKRFALFFSDPGKLFSNPFIGTGMLLMKFSEYLAAGLGLLSAKMR